MAEISNEEKLSERVVFLKRNCTLCKARSGLRPTEAERSNVKTGLKNLNDFFKNKFDALRKEDAEAGEISKAIENKRLCMDLLEECSSCGKEVDLVNRGLSRLRK